MASHDPLHDAARWVRELRRHHEGICVVGDRAVPVRFVVDPLTGQLAMPVEGWVADQRDAVLFLPEERDDALQVMIEFVGEAGGAVQDRWSAYHGMARHRCWGAAKALGARRAAEVCEGEMIAQNALVKGESRLVRLLNEHRDRLRGACQRLAGVDVPDACAVGVDQWGFDVRARFGVVRAEFPEGSCGERGVECPDKAAELIGRLLGAPGASA